MLLLTHHQCMVWERLSLVVEEAALAWSLVGMGPTSPVPAAQATSFVEGSARDISYGLSNLNTNTQHNSQIVVVRKRKTGCDTVCTIRLQP